MEFVFKKNNNKKIHVINSKYRNDGVEDNFNIYCDTTPTKAEKIEIERELPFENISCIVSDYNIEMNPECGRNITNFNSVLHSSEDGITFMLNTFNDFDVNLHSISLRKIHALIISDETSSTDTDDFLNCYNYTEQYSLDDIIMRNSMCSLVVKVTEHTLNEDFSRISGKISLSLSYYVCKDCGELISDVVECKIREGKIITGVYLYNNENNIKLSVLKKELISMKGLAWIRYYKDMIIYNKENNILYNIKNLNFSGSKYLINKYKPSIRNFNYISWNDCLVKSYDDSTETIKAKDKFRELLDMHFKETFKEEYIYTENDLNIEPKETERSFIDDLTEPIKGCNYLDKHSPMYTNFLLYKILNIKKQYNIKSTLLASLILSAKEEDKMFHSKIKGKSEKEIMAHLKLNTKRLSYIVNNELTNSYISFYKYFNDINNLNTLVSKKKECPSIYMLEASPKYKDFYHNYLKYNSEKRFLNQILPLDWSFIRDTAVMYSNIKSTVRDYGLDMTKNIRDLHDILSIDLEKIQLRNEVIPINKNIANVFKNVSIDGIEYRLAKDTDELIKVGAIMEICVGSYREEALSKSSIIVVGYNKCGAPVTCIEIEKQQTYCVRQVKKKRNALPDRKENDSLIKLFTENNISIYTNDLYVYENVPELNASENINNLIYANNLADDFNI